MKPTIKKEPLNWVSLNLKKNNKVITRLFDGIGFVYIKNMSPIMTIDAKNILLPRPIRKLSL